MNQSFSFRMLNKWIADSETHSGPQIKSKKDEEEEQAQQTAKKSEVIKAIEEEEMKKNFYNQQQQMHGRNVSPQRKVFSVNQNKIPSKVFQYVDRKYSDSDSPANNNYGQRNDSFSNNNDEANYNRCNLKNIFLNFSFINLRRDETG
jgi:hypothetical protein